MKRVPTLMTFTALAALGMSALTAMADTRPRIAAPSELPPEAAGGSPYGQFLAGRVAVNLGSTETGASYLARAAGGAPDIDSVRERAFTTALIAGDLDVAARLAPTSRETSATFREAGRLTQAVRRLGAGDARGANQLLRDNPIGFPHARAGQFVSPWVAAAANDWERALAQPPATLDPLSLAFGRYHRALLLEHRRRFDDAEAEIRDLATAAPLSVLFRVPYGEYLERRGRRTEALALYQQALDEGADDLALQVAFARASTGGAVPSALTLTEGAAMGLATAAAIAQAEEVNEFAVIYLRLANGLTPEEASLLLLGELFTSIGLNQQARDVWAQVRPDEPLLYAAARQQMAMNLIDEERTAEALVEIRRAAAALPEDPSVQLMLASVLMGEGQYEEAVEVMNSPVLNMEDQGWMIRYMRGSLYQELGRNAEAEAELWAALQLEPDDAPTLNNLGYLWIDTGTRVDEGAEMVARAVAANPESGHYQDSLGWAQYRMGQYEQAVETLELAVSLEPGSAVINDHLGDAYWRVGRRREATFQWSRALSLDADETLSAEIERKLREGLD